MKAPSEECSDDRRRRPDRSLRLGCHRRCDPGIIGLVSDEGTTPESGEAHDFREAVDKALDALLGQSPTELVEEQPEVKDPSDENEAMAHLYRAPSRFYGLG